MELVNVPIQDIVPYENNPRKNDKAVGIVAKSIKEFGFLVPIILDDKNIIVAGHTRIKAAIKLGMSEVPCIYTEGLTDAQIKAFRIMDNKAQDYAGWDFEILQKEMTALKEIGFDTSLTGFSEAEMNRILKAEPERMDGGKEPKYQIEEGVYKLGRHYLICGDCTKIDYNKILSGQKIALIYTDPPYGVSYGGNHSETTQEKIGMRMGKDWDVIEGDDLRGEDLYELLKNCFKQVESSLKENAGAYIFHASRNQMLFEKALNEAGLEMKQQLIWKKASVLSHAHYHWAHEPILYCSRKGKPVAFYGDKLNKTLIGDYNLETMSQEELKDLLKTIQKQSTVLEFKKDNSQDYIHPTQKPVNMAEFFICNSSQANEWVVDMFGGSGSTLIACENKNRRCITSELDKKYASHIMERFENLTGQKGVKINN
jgi:site-specific DNA-methyltransferase (adenine-specific)